MEDEDESDIQIQPSPPISGTTESLRQRQRIPSEKGRRDNAIQGELSKGEKNGG